MNNYESVSIHALQPYLMEKAVGLFNANFLSLRDELNLYSVHWNILHNTVDICGQECLLNNAILKVSNYLMYIKYTYAPREPLDY